MPGVRLLCIGMNSKDIVRLGYDKVSYAYRSDDQSEAPPDYLAWLSELTPLLPQDSSILDLGCGCGIPVAQHLARTFAVTGVDISPVQIGRAEKLAPRAKFIRADVSELDFPAQTFAAIVSFYAIIHVPLEEQRDLFTKLHLWLEPGGYFMGTVGSRPWTGTEEDWLGVPGAKMYWSHDDMGTYRRWLGEIGFHICWTRFIPEGDGGHELILARK